MSPRAVLADPLGLTLLLGSLLLWAAMSYLPLLVRWSERALWVLVLGVAAYVYTAVAVARAGASLPQPLRDIQAMRDAMARLHGELKASDKQSARTVLLPVLARALDRLDGKILPDFRQLLDWHHHLGGELDAYRTEKRPAPDAAILERLRALFDKQQLTIAESVKQVTDAYAFLLLLVYETDEPRVAAFAKIWRAEIEDIYGGISDVLGRDTPIANGEQPPEDREPEPSAPAPADEAAPPLDGKPHLSVVPTEAEGAGPRRDVVEEVKQTPRPAERQLPGGLTVREAEVLRHLCRGLTSREIAALLVVSITTVHRHVANIYAKVGAGRRHEAVTWALNNGLVKLADLQRPEDVA